MTKSIEEILRGSQEIVEEPIEKVTWRQRLEAAESKYSDWLSPILVKELRQSLKSRQFFYTYTAILIAVWCWSIFGIVMLLPAAYYLPAGKPLLFGYLLILAVPSIIIIPLSVHRSLASESDDDTYELLSITSLSARQIVYGKLASGMLQYLLVMSLLTPCFGFSYLLRGFSMGSLFALLAMVSLLTFLSISVGLFFAAQVRGRFGQVLALVAQLAIAVGLFVFANDVSVGLINGVLSSRVNQGDGWLMALSLCALVILIARFLLLVAAARLSPQSENRSTPIRWALLHVQTAFLFFIGLEVFADLALDTTG